MADILAAIFGTIGGIILLGIVIAILCCRTKGQKGVVFGQNGGMGQGGTTGE